MALTRRDLLGLGTAGGLAFVAGCTSPAGILVTQSGQAQTGVPTTPSASATGSSSVPASPVPTQSNLTPRHVPAPRYRSLSPDGSGSGVDGNAIDKHLASLGAYSGGPMRTVRIRPGRYRRSTPIAVPSGVRLVAAGAVFITTDPGAQTPLLDIQGVSDVAIEGGTWDGNKNELKTTSEWKHVIRVTNASRITLRGLITTNAVGDGIYIGSAQTPCRDVTITSVKCTKAGRNGMSITSVRGLKCSDSIFIKNGDRSPRAGVDIEPNSPHAPIQDVTFTRCAFTGNEQRGFLMVMQRSSPDIKGAVQLVDCTIEQNANPWGGTSLCAGLVLIRPRGVLITRGAIRGNHTGILVQGYRPWDPKKSPRKGSVRLVDVDVHNNEREGLIVLNGIRKLAADQVRFFDNSREQAGYFSGIMLAQGADMAFTDCVSTGARMYGLQASDPVRNVTLRSCDLNGNGMGELDTGSAGVTVIQ